MDGRQCENKQRGDTVLEKARDMFLCSLQINILKARQMRFSTVGYMCSTQTIGIFNPDVCYKCGGNMDHIVKIKGRRKKMLLYNSAAEE